MTNTPSPNQQAGRDRRNQQREEPNMPEPELFVEHVSNSISESVPAVKKTAVTPLHLSKTGDDGRYGSSVTHMCYYQPTNASLRLDYAQNKKK